ncbi:hypothetical protein TNCT_282121 [Trichonephila clavata]|uniref:Uncharacterized protein n=1 Tax=Trichonephila clavata TaxID=2740835 RepID=A0A8X6G4B1_TRICU|nr:hypothetical protein TNCT_282121 [Trichonephila clavata]
MDQFLSPTPAPCSRTEKSKLLLFFLEPFLSLMHFHESIDTSVIYRATVQFASELSPDWAVWRIGIRQRRRFIWFCGFLFNLLFIQPVRFRNQRRKAKGKQYLSLTDNAVALPSTDISFANCSVDAPD